MANAGTVEINFAAETAKFTAELKKVRNDLKSLKDDVGSITNTLSKFGTALKASIIGTAVVSGFRAIVKATEESEAAISQLDAALKSASSSVRISSDQFQNFAKQMQATSTFTDEAVIGVESILLAFRSLSGQTILSATSAVLDLSTRLGTDLTSAAKLVGRALEDPEKGMTALARAGVVFSQSQQAIIKSLVAMGQKAQAQQLILKELEKRFGGAAAAARETLGGALTSLGNAVGDLFEGDKNSFKNATRSINDLTKALNDPKIKEGFSNLILSASKTLEVMARLASATTAVGGAIGSFFGPAGADLKTSELLQRQLQIREDTLARQRASGFFTQEQLKVEEQYNETLRQRIEIAKRIEAGRAQRGAISALEPVSATVSRLEGPSDEDVLARLKHQQEVLDLRQKAITASIASAGAFLESLDRQLGDGEKKLTELNEEARKRRRESQARFAQDNLDIAVSEFDRRLRLEQELTQATAEENRKRVLIEQAARAEELQTRRDAAIKSVAVLGFLVSGHKSANKAIELANKISTIRQIAIDTKAAVMRTLKYFGGTPIGYAAAAAVAAFGALQIKGVLSAETTFNVGAVPAANLGNASSSVDLSAATTAASQREQVVQITVNGVITEDAVREIFDKANEMTDRGFVFINGKSNQANVIRNARP